MNYCCQKCGKELQQPINKVALEYHCKYIPCCRECELAFYEVMKGIEADYFNYRRIKNE